MTTTGDLIAKITALRHQLDQANGPGVAPSPQNNVDDEGKEPGRLWRLERQIPAGEQHGQALEGALRQLAPRTSPADTPSAMPRQLTSRARRVLERGQKLVRQLRGVADDPILASSEAAPMTVLFHETTAMADSALRMVQAFPDAPALQRSLCGGLEAILDVVSERTEVLLAGLARRRREAERTDRLAELLRDLSTGQTVEVQAFLGLAEEVLADAQEGRPMRFTEVERRDQADLPWWVASHSLAVAQVMARLVRQDPDLRAQPAAPVVAALVADAGMLHVPVAILMDAGPLGEEQRRLVERHARAGGDLAARLLPGEAWLVEAAAMHHERLDGSGYPSGLRDVQIAPLTRLLAVCDVYAALCQGRPHRPAFDPRTALTDTLLLAERGLLDRAQAERLLCLSFYPVGSVVELADGAVGIVVATHAVRRDLGAPARPVVALLTDSDGKGLAAPCLLDLAQSDHRSIVRTVSGEERWAYLGPRLTEWA
jgi:HD-GYP domain-containing protein (c-di-GMP phosphodiesterase class II)